MFATLIFSPRQHRIFLADDELNRLFSALDADGSGDLSFEEFVEIVVHHRQLTQLSLVNDNRPSLMIMKNNMLIPGKLWPDAPFRCYWDCLVAIFILWYTIVVPLEIMRYERGDDEHCFKGWGYFLDAVGTLIFLADVGIVMNTIMAPSYLQPATMFTVDRKVLLRKRIRSPFFIIDVPCGP